jgi:membrane-bound lytic murein transglycosylase D
MSVLSQYSFWNGRLGFTASCVVMLALASCSTTREVSSFQMASKSKSSNGNWKTIDRLSDPTIDAVDLTPDEIAHGIGFEEEIEFDEAAALEEYDGEFCKDNLYANYLRDEYLRLNQKARNPEKEFKPTRKGRRRGVATRSPYNSREVEALYFARSRLVGESVSYFGAIPVVSNPRVEHWVRFFKTNGRRSYLKWLVRGESVKNLALPILKEQGMPLEFLFLSMVESGFSNQASSSAKATGPWQFMQGTAKLYGLKMTPWIDERRDPAKSSNAAARLLRDLYAEFGDWYLAMAAYNAGPGRVRSAMRQTGSKDFWVLADSPYLPVETKNYVPKVLAALLLASNPSGHGFEVVGDPLDLMPVTTVPIEGATSIKELSESLGVGEKMLRHWNPELIAGITPPASASKPYLLRIAPQYVSRWEKVSQNIVYVDVKDVLVHRIRRGETLASIAAMYKVRVENIIKSNPGLSSKRLKIGRELAVPIAHVAQSIPKQKKSALAPKKARSVH